MRASCMRTPATALFGLWILVFALPMPAAPVSLRVLPDFVPLVESSAPAVVNISTTQTAKRPAGPGGELPEALEIDEGGVVLRVDPLHGQKTGLFLDQRENHVMVRQYARGRVLDAFCYEGGFALQASRVSEEVLAVDASAEVGHHDRDRRIRVLIEQPPRPVCRPEELGVG